MRRRLARVPPGQERSVPEVPRWRWIEAPDTASRLESLPRRVSPGGQARDKGKSRIEVPNRNPRRRRTGMNHAVRLESPGEADHRHDHRRNKTRPRRRRPPLVAVSSKPLNRLPTREDRRLGIILSVRRSFRLRSCRRCPPSRARRVFPRPGWPLPTRTRSDRSVPWQSRGVLVPRPRRRRG